MNIQKLKLMLKLWEIHLALYHVHHFKCQFRVLNALTVLCSSRTLLFISKNWNSASTQQPPFLPAPGKHHITFFENTFFSVQKSLKESKEKKKSLHSHHPEAITVNSWNIKWSQSHISWKLDSKVVYKVKTG
jgi:hypothetical protein